MNINKEINPAKGVVTESIDQVSVMAPVDIPTAGNFGMKTRQCNKCGRDLPLTPVFFFRNNSSAEGFIRTCKECRGYRFRKPSHHMFSDVKKGYKICSVCEAELPEVDFLVNKDGSLYGRCKKCKAKDKQAYRRTKEGLAAQIYWSQKHSKILKNTFPIEYSKEALKEWLFNQPIFHELYETWVQSGYDTYSRPSVNRIDTFRGYSFDNIELMTFRQNKQQYTEDCHNNTNSRELVPIMQYSMDGDFVREYPSVQSALAYGFVQPGITSVCSGRRRSYKGFLWEYKYGNQSENRYNFKKYGKFIRVEKSHYMRSQLKNRQ